MAKGKQMKNLAYGIFILLFMAVGIFEIVNGSDAAGLIAMACAILLQIDLHLQDRQKPN